MWPRPGHPSAIAWGPLVVLVALVAHLEGEGHLDGVDPVGALPASFGLVGERRVAFDLAAGEPLASFDVGLVGGLRASFAAGVRLASVVEGHRASFVGLAGVLLVSWVGLAEVSFDPVAEELLVSFGLVVGELLVSFDPVAEVLLASFVGLAGEHPVGVVDLVGVHLAWAVDLAGEHQVVVADLVGEHLVWVDPVAWVLQVWAVVLVEEHLAWAADLVGVHQV